MKTYRIAMIAACPFPANHGSPASIREMSMALAERGHEIHLVTYPFGQDEPVPGVRIHRIPSFGLPQRIAVGPTPQKPLYDMAMVVKLCRVIRRERIELIHAHNVEGALIGAIAGSLMSIPFLYNAVNSMEEELPTYYKRLPRGLLVRSGRFLDWLLPRFADGVTVVSHELFDLFKSRGIPAKRMVVVPAGVIPEMFSGGDGREIRARYSLGNDPVLIYTGTLDRFQRLDYLFQAVRIVRESIPHVKLLVVGGVADAGLLREHQELAKQLGVDRNILFIGPQPLSALPSFFASADVAVLPRPECPGHPVKLLNYMAAGKAIVAFRGSAKGLRHMYNGVVIEDHRCEEMGHGIVTLLKDESLKSAIGRNARSSIDGIFDWSSIAKGITDIYSTMIKNIDKSRPIDDHINRHLKSRYEPVFMERRDGGPRTIEQERRNGERRRENCPISFLERRKMTYL